MKAGLKFNNMSNNQDSMTCAQCHMILERPYGKTFCSSGCVYEYEKQTPEHSGVFWHDYRFWPPGTSKQTAFALMIPALNKARPFLVPRFVWAGLISWLYKKV